MVKILSNKDGSTARRHGPLEFKNMLYIHVRLYKISILGPLQKFKLIKKKNSIKKILASHFCGCALWDKVCLCGVYCFLLCLKFKTCLLIILIPPPPPAFNRLFLLSCLTFIVCFFYSKLKKCFFFFDSINLKKNIWHIIRWYIERILFDF